MLELELPDEAQAVAEPVCDEQHEAMEVEDAVAELRLVVVEVQSRTNPLPKTEPAAVRLFAATAPGEDSSDRPTNAAAARNDECQTPEF